MRASIVLMSASCLWNCVAFAGDNAKQIEKLLHNYSEAIAKANDVRAKATEKSRNEAIAQLTKLASTAYSEKDRLSETNAWKGVLMLDRSNAKANQYFKDLGTLEQVLKSIPEDSAGGSAFRVAGKWQVACDNEARFKVEFSPEGKMVKEGDETYAKIAADRESVTYRNGVTVDKYTVAGNRLLFEQWYPASIYPNSAPSNLGIVFRLD